MKKGTKIAIWASVAVVIIGAAVGGILWKQYEDEQKRLKEIERQQNEILAKQTFYEGILIDGVDVSNLTRAQAREKLEVKQRQLIEDISLSIRYQSQSWSMALKDLQPSFNTDAVMDEAMKLGRTGTRDEKLEQIEKLKVKPESFTTDYQLPEELNFPIIDTIEEALYIEPKEPVVSIDMTKANIVQVAPGANGRKADTEKLRSDILDVLKNRSYDLSITVNASVVSPEHDAQYLQNNIRSIGKKTTVAANNAPRNVNIDLFSKAIQGYEIKPGEEFDCNKYVGERTPEKGYQIANGILNGEYVPEYGGGICQVSSTLYNAVVYADLEIIKRQNHSLRNTYMDDDGQDATISWGGPDFIFKNNRDTSVYIICRFEKRSDGRMNLTVELYGLPSQEELDGRTIEIMTTYKKFIEPSAPVYTIDPGMKAGDAPILTKKAEDGIYCEVYKIYKKNGVEINREFLNKSTYRAIPAKYKIGPSPGPTVLPENTSPASPSPSPAAPPSPSPTPIPSPSIEVSPSPVAP